MNRHCEYLNYVEGVFGDHFGRAGYRREEPVAVSSGIDSSVDLVGSKISVLKPFVLRGDIAPEGHWLIQDCLRTRGIKDLKTGEPRKFGSCFRTMGTLTNPDIKRVVFDTFDYLVYGIGIERRNLLIKINPDDEDLIAATESVAGDIRREEHAADAHYRHRYGLNDLGIFGRDFNIAGRIRETDKFASVGTVVLMEQNDRTIGVDMGLGNLSLAMCEFGGDNTVAVSRMADVFCIDSVGKQRLADSLMVVAMLQREGAHKLSYHGSKGKIREKYNKYQQAVSYWKSQFGLSNQEVLRYMDEYICLEFGDTNFKSEATWAK